MSTAILTTFALWSLPAPLDEGQDAETVEALAGACDADAFYLQVATDLRAAFDALREARRTMTKEAYRAFVASNAGLSGKSAAFLGIASAGVAELESSPYFAKPKAVRAPAGPKGETLPSYHVALWSLVNAACAPVIRATIDRVLGPDRAKFEATCEGLPAEVTDTHTYLTLSGKYQGIYSAKVTFHRHPSVKVLASDLGIQTTDLLEYEGPAGKDGKRETIGLPFGFRNDRFTPVKAPKVEAGEAAKSEPEAPKPEQPVEGA